MSEPIDKILSTIEEAITNFQDKVPAVQKAIFEELQTFIKDFEIKGGKLLNNVKNLKLILGLKNKLEKLIVTSDYKDSVKQFIDSFTQVSNLNIDYFRQFNKTFTPSATLPLIKQIAVESTINSLVGDGLVQSVIEPVQKILVDNIITGGSYSKFQDELRNHILTNDTGEGKLERYTKQITTDAINQYSAQYHAVIAQDLSFNWGQYVGSLLTTSREFCILLTQKRWVHKSELPEIIKGHIDGKTCVLSKTTKLPLGMIPDTNKDNFLIRRGGYKCGHGYYMVPDSSVPKDLLSKFTGNSSPVKAK